ncbi:hypothetical protein ACNKHK_22805 [Shigella flexneri]
MSRKIAVIGECMIELSQKGADVQRGFGGETLEYIRLYRPSGRCCGIPYTM